MLSELIRMILQFFSLLSALCLGLQNFHFTIELVHTTENVFKLRLNKKNVPFYLRTVFRTLLDDNIRVPMNLQLQFVY